MQGVAASIAGRLRCRESQPEADATRVDALSIPGCWNVKLEGWSRAESCTRTNESKVCYGIPTTCHHNVPLKPSAVAS
jgi:hypothetical protein